MITKLIIGNIFGNKKKTIISIICICFSVMLIYVSVNSYMSFQKMRIENAYDAYGEYNIILHEVNSDICDWVSESYAEKAQIGIEEIAGVTDSGITLVNCDYNTIEMSGYKLVDGELPTKEGETALSSTAEYDGDYIINNYGVGDSIVLNDQTYIISGIIDDYDYSTTDTYKIAIITEEKVSDIFNIYLHYDDKQDYMSAYTELKTYLGLDEENIFDGDKNNGFLGGYRLILNLELNNIEIEGEASLQDINIGRLLICFAIVLVFTSLILGIHIFLSYLNGRNRQQGILMCLGFSNSHISFIYITECLVLTFVGCVLGIIAGRYLTILLFSFIQTIRITKLDNFEPEFTGFSLVIVIIISLINFIIGMLPVIIRNMNMNIIDIIKGKKGKYKISHNTREYKTRFVTIKYFLRDNYLYEKLCIYFSMVLIGMAFMLTLKVNKYIEHMLSDSEDYSTQFELLSEDISGMDNFQDLIPEIEYYDLVYDTTGEFYIDKSIINEEYGDGLLYEKNGTVYCEIVGVSELQYERKIELSNEVSYEEFVQSGGAIIIDNYTDTDQTILNCVPSALGYDGRGDNANFEAGEISIMGRSRFKNWDYQRGVSIVVPLEMFKEKFDYTIVSFKINVKSGYEIEAAELLNKYSYMYNYTFNDYSTEYIKEQDDSSIIRLCTYGMLAFVTVINLFTLVYINMLIYIRRRKNISVLKVMGHSNTDIMLPVILEMVAEGVASTIIAACIVTVLVKRFVPVATQNIILTDGLNNMLCIFVFIIFIQIISALNILVHLYRQKIINDLRLQ